MTKSEAFVLVAVPHHGGPARALPCPRARERRVSMCWSKYEREQWERERREAEAERLRFISTTEPKTEEPEPQVEADERETELVRS
jgi:hypothetical protein